MAKKKRKKSNGSCFISIVDIFIGCFAFIFGIIALGLTAAGFIAISTGTLIVIIFAIGIFLIYLIYKTIKFIIKIVSSSGSNIEGNSLENTAYAVVPVETESYVPDYFDTYFEEAGRYIIEKNQASIGMIQRMFKIGFNRAARIMDQLCDVGVVSPESVTKPRKVLMSLKEFELFMKSDYLNCIPTSVENTSSFNIENDRLTLYNGKFDYMTGSEFEYYCADLLKKSGFTEVSVTPASGDYGADILAQQHGIKYAIQCKCYSSDIGVDAVYQISGGMKYYQANVGCVLTNRYFTSQAKELADKIGIILWDRDFLNELVQRTL